ncbi:hypothetical protein BDR07DRAFT_1377073 [Suillus spraguei]|nr:hypothetical protein BDR07DRAFT_1377073 [Suillus spraguei]
MIWSAQNHATLLQFLSLPSMENVSGGVGVVIEQKKAITTQIDDLTAHFSSHQDTLHGPIEINTDALQQASVDHSDKISQIILFLCVACRVVMGSAGVVVI